MGTTTHHTLPYPEPSGRARNGSVDIKALAEAVDVLLPDLDYAAAQVGPANSPTAADGSVIAFPGAVTLLNGFAWDGSVLTYNAADGGARLFVVLYSVEIDTAGVDLAGIESSVSLQVNGVEFDASYDRVDSFHTADNVGTLRRRTYVHRIAVPVALSVGQTLRAVATSNPTGQVGSCHLRVYPMGPR
jgi:hypothetical protein